jgi:hypothetical protein
MPAFELWSGRARDASVDYAWWRRLARRSHGQVQSIRSRVAKRSKEPPGVHQFLILLKGSVCHLLIGGAFKVAQLPATGRPANSFLTNGTESTSDALTAPP